MKNTKSKISIIWENFSTEIVIFLIIVAVIACGIAGIIIQKYYFPESVLKNVILNFVMCAVYSVLFSALVIAIIMLFIDIAVLIKEGASYLFRKIKAVKNYCRMEFTEDAIRNLITQGTVTDGYSYMEHLSKQLCVKETSDKKQSSEWVLLSVDDISHMVTAYQKVFDEPVVLMNGFQKMFSRLNEMCDYSAAVIDSNLFILYANAEMEMKKLTEYKKKHLDCKVFTVNVTNGVTDIFEKSYFKD